MERVAIIGSSGAGKSTLARNLKSILDMKVLHLDRCFWKHNWEEKNEYERAELLEKFIFWEKRWIIEGNYLRFAELHIKAADTITFLDLPPLLCLWRRIKRHYENQGLPHRDIPEGCTDRITLGRMLKILFFPFGGRRTIEKTLSNYPSKNIIRLRSAQEVERFLAKQKHINNDERSSVDIVAFTIREMLTAGL